MAFQRLGVEVAVVEVGMGGRVDATNVLAKPLATVFTPVGHDHAPPGLRPRARGRGAPGCAVPSGARPICVIWNQQSPG